MFSRRYWAKAGGALMGIALASALADLITRSAADHPNDVPLWPLIICVALFIAGGLLFAFRAPDEPQAPIIQAQLRSAIADNEPIDISRFFDGHTDIQAERLLKAHYGKQIRVTGHLENVGTWDPYSGAAVSFQGAPLWTSGRDAH